MDERISRAVPAMTLGSERKNQVADTRAEHAGQRDVEDHARDGLDNVTDPHDQVVPEPPVESGNGAENHAEDRREDDGPDADDQRIPCADHDAAEDVSSHLIRPERMRKTWVQEPAPCVDGHIVIRGNPRSQNRYNRDKQEQDQSHHGAFVVGKPLHHLEKLVLLDCLIRRLQRGDVRRPCCCLYFLHAFLLLFFPPVICDLMRGSIQAMIRSQSSIISENTTASRATPLWTTG